MHSGGASVDLDNAVLLIVNYEAILSCRLVPWWSRYRHTFDVDDAGTSRKKSTLWGLIGIGYSPYYSSQCYPALTEEQITFGARI